ncbi:MAG: HDIG domain-containing protein [Deltaproteobacteria bacterium]|nr:HDIG domain-containing protein [Deltaproteobacteria bacterium]
MSYNKKQLSSKDGSVQVNVVPEFTRDPLFQRWTILIIMSMILTLLLSPQIHLISPVYKVGTIATKDIKADRDFLVEDKASTEQKRLEAAQKGLPICDYDKNMPSFIGASLARAFLRMEEAYKTIGGESSPPKSGQDVLKKAQDDFNSTLGLTLTKEEFAVLNRHKFSFDICNNIVKLIYSVYNKGPISNGDLLHLNKDNGIIIRNIWTQNERTINNFSSLLSMEEAKKLIIKNSSIVFSKEQSNLQNVAISVSKRLIRPNLTFAKNATEKRKQLLMDDVKPVFYKVQKNEMIVREGEKISPIHSDKLAALYKGEEGIKFLNISIFLGMFLSIMLFSIILYLIFEAWLTSSAKNITTDVILLSIAAILQVLLARIGIFLCESINNAFPLIPVDACFYAIPFAAATMLIVTLLNRDVGLIFAVFSAFLISFLFEAKASMFFYSMLGSMVAAFKITECKKRSAFFKTGLFVGLVNMAVIICLLLLAGKLITTDTLFNLVMGFVGGILSAAVVQSIIPLFESLLGYTTDIKLLELANLNQPIFQNMIMVAPGTYHHSIVVASMVEAAAEAINANSLLAKVSSYYHDIGKIKKSLYFIENQIGYENKLDKLSPKMSSLVIISHVKEGCELAKEYKLGRAITDIIRQHHGTRLVGYFYEKAQRDKDPSVRSIPEGEFRYPGPKPLTREAGLVLLGDVIEASSRALTNPTPSRIKNLVEDRMNQILMEGELNESDLTFHDLSKVADSFTRTLNGIFHQRIDYPVSTAKENNEGKDRNGNSNRKPSEKNRHRYSKSSSSS